MSSFPAKNWLEILIFIRRFKRFYELKGIHVKPFKPFNPLYPFDIKYDQIKLYSFTYRWPN